MYSPVLPSNIKPRPCYHMAAWTNTTQEDVADLQLTGKAECEQQSANCPGVRLPRVAHLCILLYTCIYLCDYEYTFVYVCIRVYTCVNVVNQVCSGLLTCVCVCILMYVCAYLFIHVHTYEYLCTVNQVLGCLPLCLDSYGKQSNIYRQCNLPNNRINDCKGANNL